MNRFETYLTPGADMIAQPGLKLEVLVIETGNRFDQWEDPYEVAKSADREHALVN